MKSFRNIVGNPPFQDSVNRGKTFHKLWIDFTKFVDKILPQNGNLGWVTPQSIIGPGWPLDYLKGNKLRFISFDTNNYFKEAGNDVGVNMCHFFLQKGRNNNDLTNIIRDGKAFDYKLSPFYPYIPNDFCEDSISIHKKVIFDSVDKLIVKFDYVTCHNVQLVRVKENCPISKKKTNVHIYPILHTNKQIWWTSIRQNFADKKKVMWSRSGTTKPFYDDCKLGGTDMVYYILVHDDDSGEILDHNLNTILFKYIFKTAKWSGFGSEKVFCSLPVLPNKMLTNNEMFNHFGISDSEKKYVKRTS